MVSDASEILHDVAPFRMLNRQRYEMLLERAYKFDFVATKVGSTWAPLDSGDERVANNLFHFLDTNKTQEIDSKEFFGALMFFEADYSLPSEKGCNVSQTSNPFYLLQHLFVIYASSGKVVWSEDMDCGDVGTVTLEDLKGMWSCLARDQSTCAHLIHAASRGWQSLPAVYRDRMGTRIGLAGFKKLLESSALRQILQNRAQHVEPRGGLPGQREDQRLPRGDAGGACRLAGVPDFGSDHRGLVGAPDRVGGDVHQGPHPNLNPNNPDPNNPNPNNPNPNPNSTLRRCWSIPLACGS